MDRHEYLGQHKARRTKILSLLRKQSVKAVSDALGISTQRIYTIRNDAARKNGHSGKRKP